jgi:hypothetical protein
MEASTTVAKNGCAGQIFPAKPKFQNMIDATVETRRVMRKIRMMSLALLYAR